MILELDTLSEAISFLKNKENILKNSYFLNEDSDITYYELRKLFAVLEKQTKDPVSRRVIMDILTILTKLEVRNVPIPLIKKSLSKSKKVFKTPKKK